MSRLTGAISVAILLLFVRTQAAFAAPMAMDEKVGQTPAALAWIQLQDSRGISIWHYELSLDRGGVTSPDKFFWSSITDTCWGAYRSWCALALWFLDWVMSFDWVNTIASPLLAVGDAMQSVVNRVGLVPSLLMITAVVAVVWMARGKYATGLGELGVALIIASLASGVFAQPVEMIAGPSGYVVKANQVGQQLAAELAIGDAEGKTPEQLRQAQTGQLVDTFIRQPTQMMNFGRVLDGGKCEKAYNDVIRGGPYGNDDDIRTKVGDCDSALGDYAGEPTASMAIGSVVFMPAAFVILLMALVLAGSVIAAGCWAMFQSLKAIVTLVTGLLPGGGRGSLLLTVAETVISLFIIIFTSVFLSVFLLVIQALFKGGSGESLPKTFVIADILIIVGTVIYWRQRKQLKATSQRLAQWMSQRPGGAPATRLPDRSPGLGMGPASTAVRTVTGLAQLRAQRAAANRASMSGPTFIDARQQAAFFGNMPRRTAGDPLHFDVVPRPGPGTGGRGRPQLSGGGNPQLPAGPNGPGPNGPGPSGGGAGSGLARTESRKTKVAGALVRAGTNAALAYATGGASTVVTGAATASKAGRAVNTARRAAVTSRLALAAGKSASGSGRRPIPMPSGRPATSGPMPARAKPTPTPGRPQHRPAASGQVITGQVISSKLASQPGKPPGSATGKKLPAGRKNSAASTGRPSSPPAPSSSTRPSTVPITAPAQRSTVPAKPAASSPRRDADAAHAERLRARLAKKPKGVAAAVARQAALERTNRAAPRGR